MDGANDVKPRLTTRLTTRTTMKTLLGVAPPIAMEIPQFIRSVAILRGNHQPKRCFNHHRCGISNAKRIWKSIFCEHSTSLEVSFTFLGPRWAFTWTSPDLTGTHPGHSTKAQLWPLLALPAMMWTLVTWGPGMLGWWMEWMYWDGCIGMDIYGYLWISMDIYGYLWISMDKWTKKWQDVTRFWNGSKKNRDSKDSTPRNQQDLEQLWVSTMCRLKFQLVCGRFQKCWYTQHQILSTKCLDTPTHDIFFCVAMGQFFELTEWARGSPLTTGSRCPSKNVVLCYGSNPPEFEAPTVSDFKWCLLQKTSSIFSRLRASGRAIGAKDLRNDLPSCGANGLVDWSQQMAVFSGEN